MIKTLTTSVLICVCVFVFTSCASDDHKKEDAALHLRIGTSDLAKGFYPQALSELLQAEQLAPNEPVIENNLGLAYFVRKEYGQSLTHISKAIDLSPNYSDARNNLGRVYIELARYDDAISQLTIVTRDLTYPTPEKAYVNLGLAYLKKGDNNTALNTFKKSLEANNKFCPGYNYYGQSLFQLGRYEAALDAFEKALSLCKNRYDEAHYFSALSLYKSGQIDKAHARLQEVVKFYPSSDFSIKAKEMLKIIR